MNPSHHYGRFYNQVKPALESKIEEFEIFGYEQIREKELWDYLTKKKWKKATEEAQIYEIVADILSAKIGEVMNFTTVEAFKLGEFTIDDEEERKELLK